MDEKTTKYVNNLVSLLTRQRNDAMDLNAKLQVELAMAQAELAGANKKDEDKKKDEKKAY